MDRCELKFQCIALVNGNVERAVKIYEFVTDETPPSRRGLGVGLPHKECNAVAFTRHEGGEWIYGPVHALKFANGREWDVINGWRDA